MPKFWLIFYKLTTLNKQLSIVFHKTKSFPRQNDNVLVLTADKGAKIVIMDKNIYITKSNDMLGDNITDKYTCQISANDYLQSLRTKTNKG